MIHIVGGSGFIGSAFVRYAERHGLEYRVIAKENYAALAGTPCDVLINANGNSKRYLAREDPPLDFDLSVRSVMRVLFDFPAQVHVYLSSAAVYPDTADRARTREDSPIVAEDLDAYGLHKWLAEQLVRRYHPAHLVIRIGGVVGPAMTKSPAYDLMHGVPLRVGADSRYQYLHTDDLAAGVFRLLELGLRNETFNMTGRDNVPLTFVQELLGRRGEPDNLPTETWDIDVDKAHALLDLPTSADTLRRFFAGVTAR